MTEGVKTIMYPVTDIATAKALYGTLLGVEPYSTFQCDRPTSHDADMRSHRRIRPNGHNCIDLRAGQCQCNPLYMDEPYYVGFNVEGQDIGLDPRSKSKGMTEPIAYWHVDDIEESLKALLGAGAEAHQGVRDVGGGKLIASVKDADGNVIGLLQSP
jgi:hypothetical protein